MATDGNGNTQLTAILTAIQNGVSAVNNASYPVALSEIALNFSSSGDNTVITQASNKTVKLYSLFLTVAGTTKLEFKDGQTLMTGPMTFSSSYPPFFLDFRTQPWFTCSVTSPLVINNDSPVQVSGRAYYTQT